MVHFRPILRFVLMVVAHPRLTLGIVLALTTACIALAASRLTISTNQNELFSDKVPFFRDYLDFDRKFPENEAVYILIEPRSPAETPPVERWTGAADAVASALRKMPEFVHSVDQRVPIDELGSQGLLFDDPALVRQAAKDVHQFIPLVKLFAEKPGLLDQVFGPTPIDQFLGKLNLAPADAQTAAFTTLLARSWSETMAGGGEVRLPDLAALDAGDPQRLGYYYVPDESDPARQRRVLLVRVYPNKDFSSLTANARKINAIRAAVAEAIKPFPEFVAGTTGRPALEADEMITTDRDSTRAEIVALIAVFIGMALLLRSLYLALVAELALGVGVAWTFAWATLSVGRLNLLSIVFFLALIGIGMDYLVQILSRYRREVERRTDPRIIWIAVFRQVGPPINTACMGAAGAFLVSLFTDFRGAVELGLIAGGGLLLCLLSGYTFLPAVLRLIPLRVQKTSSKQDSSPAAPPVLHPPASILAFARPAIWVLLLVAGLPFALRTGFNPGLLELQARNLPSVQLVRKLQTWSAVVLSRDLNTLRAAEEAVAGLPSVGYTESILTAYDNAAWLRNKAKLPAIQWQAHAAVGANDLPRLATKAKTLAERFAAAPNATSEQRGAAAALQTVARELSAPPDHQQVASRLTAWQTAFQAQLRTLLQSFQPADPDITRLPEQLRSHYVASDGTYALYIYPKQDLWKQEHLGAFITEIESRLGQEPRISKQNYVLTGIAHNIHHSTSSIRASFYRATFYALGLIFVLVLIDLRSLRHTLLAISVLGLGLPMLVALMGLFEIDWNFANFFGLPILIGAGHEYGVFMVHRYRESLRNAGSPRHHWGAWDVADSALLLCAFITSASFGFFWLFAHHEGIKSLGWVMWVGTICIYLATVVALRPVLKLLLGRSSRV